MPSWTKYLLIAGVAALVLVLVQNWRAQTDAAAWAVVAGEAVRNGDVDAMESALVQVRGTSAEPHLAYLTAQRLYELGGEANFDRARSLASTSLAEIGDHPMREAFEELLAAVDSFEGAPAQNEGLANIPGSLGF